MRRIWLVVVTILAFGCSSHKTDQEQPPSIQTPSELQKSFEKSLAAFKSLSAERGGNYQYRITRGGPLTPYVRWTEIEVKAGAVARRKFYYSGSGIPADQPAYEETGAALNSHTYGETPKTAEAIYEECRSRILPLTNHYDVSISTYPDGVLSACRADYRKTELAPPDSGFKDLVRLMDFIWLQ